jgi:hypothetical protein
MKTMNLSFTRSYILFCLLLIIESGCKSGDDNAPKIELPSLTTVAIHDITQSTAMSGGEISSDGGAGITARGVCWNTVPSPTIADNKTTDGAGAGSYSSDITGLSSGTNYFLRAYATNSEGTAYGQEVSFETTPVSLLNNLLSYWKLDESAGNMAADAVGSWPLSFVGSPTWSTSGKINNSIDFGTTSARYLEKTGVNSGNKNTFTLAAWIYLTDGSADAEYIMGMNSGETAINAGAAEVKLTLVTDNNLSAQYHTANGFVGPMQRISGTTIELNTWYHVAGVINNGDIALYINGVSDNTNPVTNSLNSNLNFSNGRVTVGQARLYDGAYIPTRWFKGKIDEAAIWDRALTSDEVVSLYNNGSGLQHPF